MRLGIDFGTCYSSAAFMKEGVPTPVKFGHNETSLPSSACVDNQGRLRVGRVAENLRRGNPARYQREFKLDLGASTPYQLGELPILPEQLVREVLRELKREAENHSQNGAPMQATITVPANYSKLKRQLMSEAGRAAGFTEVALLEEPVAAAIYHASRQGPERDGEITLVYDLGGGTFDAALIRKDGEDYVTLAAPTGSRCGGVDFDRLISNRLLKQSDESLRAALSAADVNAMRGRLIFADECRELKHRLSAEEEVEDELLLLPQAPLLSVRLTRDEFNAMISGLLDETWDLCRSMVEGAGLKMEQVERVLLVGGSSRIPYVQKAAARELGRPVVRVDEPELAVALGAAIYSTRQVERAGTETPKPVTTAQSFINSVGMEFILVPPGSFMMGSNDGYRDEAPVHQVTIGYTLYMGKYQVTQAQWHQVMGQNPSHFKGDNLPVENVSWDDAQEFIRRLDAMGDGYTYRLPTEAEWEYACRAGTTEDYVGEFDAMVWYSGNSGGRTQPVGTKQPNPFGLFDMQGNVWEWCLDQWHPSYEGAPADGSVWLSGGYSTDRLLRGGSYVSSLASNLRISSRRSKEPDYRNEAVGFRLVATPWRFS